MQLKGRLDYVGWFNLPWKLITGNGGIDLWPIIDKFLTSLNGKHASFDCGSDSFVLKADKNPKLQFRYDSDGCIPGGCIRLENPLSPQIFNVQAYLSDILVWLSGRLVKIKIEDGKQMKLVADKSEEVFGVYFIGNGNSCEIPNGDEYRVCKIHHLDRCIFVRDTKTTENGFCCEKFNGTAARLLLDRLAKNSIGMTRIGNCAILGRKENEATHVAMP